MTETDDKPNNPSISFKLSEDGTQLIAVLPNGLPALNLPQLNKLIAEAGYSNWRLLDDALANVCSLSGNLENQTEVIIGHCIDGEVTIEVADDATCAYLSLTAPVGGKPVTLDQVHKALAELNIIQGINSEAIQSALALSTTEKCLIAEGIPPQNGEDSKFESLIPAAINSHPHINEDGSVDYHDIGNFITVNAGDKLMRKIPPTKGLDGKDVYGKAIPATPGKDINFSTKLAGVEIDANDNTLLVASTGGQPEVVENGVTVNPVINVKDVNLSTGNIDFNGTVNIQGDVAEGMKIKSTGDIIVSGMVEGANLQAGGNIIISKGIIGRGELRTATGEPGQAAAILSSGGSIEARFIENAIAHADQNITAKELISHSEISALNQVVVGKKGAKKGHILGGKTKALMAIEAQILGSPANVKTIIEVGNDPELHEKSKKLTADHEEKIEEYAKLSTLINRLKTQTDEKSKSIMTRALNTLQKLNAD